MIPRPERPVRLLSAYVVGSAIDTSRMPYTCPVAHSSTGALDRNLVFVATQRYEHSPYNSGFIP